MMQDFMLRVFIGTEDAQWLPTEVLKYSILRRSKEKYELKELKDIPLKLKLKMYTGFSFYRFSIPETCHFEGRALYLDADIVVLTDLKEMFALDLKDKGVLARKQPPDGWFTSVMLMDCAKLKHWKIHEWVTLVNANIASYSGIMTGSTQGINHKDFGPLEDYWNHLDHWDETTKIIHYTQVPMQPWKKPGHPFGHVFLKELKSALKDKAISVKDVQREIEAGHVYPTILQDAENA
jgi:lipopolysaccharide biosynthesis glycosyltransferase